VELPPRHWFATRDLVATGPLYFQSYLYANTIAGKPLSTEARVRYLEGATAPASQ
jgi:hypothetical protein